ncbi:Thioesterase/thiol ester dehydrase-isomerase [Vararia minispora EC-137]|uniref:Thioesterase/thiol ester dehydrase-isomerase n=1 Tax=Vararia minispora EC-137 TaxID=1314806 RepID=A0ACB8QX79_9AGAM|nr:Thioesterase/thiol ester dehydrase-isomerase [Vararia minispora EC-137]
MSACLRFTRRVWKSFLDQKGLNITLAKPGRIEASLKIEPYNGTVHGGLLLSLTDTIGSLAVASKGQYMTGVSTDISASFVRPAGKPGEILKMVGTVTALGRSLAYTRIDFFNEKGDLAAYGTHTKYVGKSAGHKNDVKLSEDGESVMEGEDVD